MTAPPKRSDRGRRVAGVLAVASVLALLALCIAYESAEPQRRAAGRSALDRALAAGQDAPEPSDQDFLVSGPWRAGLWLAVLALLAFAWTCTGRAFSPSWGAIFISRNNRVSLSQVQFTLWTLLFASSMLALFLVRLRGLPGVEALAGLPTEAALLMGVSSASFGGAQIIHAAKRKKEPSPEDVERIVRRKLREKGLAGLADRVKPFPIGKALKAAEATVAGPAKAAKAKAASAPAGPAISPAEAQVIVGLKREVLNGATGVLARDDRPGSARLLNLIQGDEITNRDNMDLGKMQLAFFTFAALLAYALLLWRFFMDGTFHAAGSGPSLDTLPPVSEGLVALLGASHLGYLGTKGAGATSAA